jgi:hypothetical protein
VDRGMARNGQTIVRTKGGFHYEISLAYI